MSMTHNKNNNANNSMLLNELLLNVVLTELSPDLRQEYYVLVEQERYQEAKDFVLKYIPDLENKLLERAKELSKE